MLTRLFSKIPVRQVLQVRNASNFNRYPVYKVTFGGIGGNAWLLIGAGSLIVTCAVMQKYGGLLPDTPGWGGLFPAKGIPMDLTPDELKEQTE